MERSTLSTAEQRKPVVVAAALQEFSRGGYHGTTIADVGREAQISSAYVFKLFPGKEQLFVAALDSCFDRVEAALEAGAGRATSDSPEAILDAMGEAYAALISDRTLLLIQVHAQSVAGIPRIREALQRGLARVTHLATSRSGAADEAVQHFIAYGQLCHLIVTARIADVHEDWAALLSRGIRHPES